MIKIDNCFHCSSLCCVTELRNRKMQLECMQYLIDLLPVANRDTLYALLGLFAKVVENCQDTRTKTGKSHCDHN